jgi:integrase
LAKPVEKRPVPGLLFAHAVRDYAKRHDGNAEYLLKLLDEIGQTPLENIDQDFIDALAEKLYPGRTAATLNRQVYTPICAVLNAVRAKKYIPPRIKRPNSHLARSNFKRPPKDWFPRVLPECEPHLAAFLLFCRLHGRRTSEACRITPADLDADTWRVTVRDTKVGQEIVLRLASPVIEALGRYPWRLEKYVFKFSSKARVYKALKVACARAGVPYHVPKDVGRHSFATALLDEGRSLMEVKEAGRWKTIQMPALHYGHLEHRRVDDDARAIGEKWAEKTLRTADIVSPFKRADGGQEKP